MLIANIISIILVIILYLPTHKIVRILTEMILEKFNTTNNQLLDNKIYTSALINAPGIFNAITSSILPIFLSGQNIYSLL